MRLPILPEIEAAQPRVYEDTHNIAEGAAAALAAALKDAGRYAGRDVGVILTGGNVDRGLFTEALATQPVSDPGPQHAIAGAAR